MTGLERLRVSTPLAVEPAAPDLAELVAHLRDLPGFRRKRDIQRPASYFPRETASAFGPILNGDDAAAIPDGDGYCLLAAEGMTPEFAKADPWFAGFCAVMVNVSDIAAMGGRPIAVVDVLFESDVDDNDRILSGMRDASEAFGVPVVGGHTGRIRGNPVLAAAIVGRAKALISSFTARPGQVLMFAVDLHGAYRGELNFNAATHSNSAQLRSNLELFPRLSEMGLVKAGKDVSMAGLLGTIAMLCEASGCAADVDLGSIPKPPGVPHARWLASFPSFGFVLAVEPECVAKVQGLFTDCGIVCNSIGRVSRGTDINVHGDGRCVRYWSSSEVLTGYGPAAPLQQRRVPTNPHPGLADQ